jgi:hypothetical protein
VFDSHRHSLGYPASRGIQEPRKQSHSERHRLEETPPLFGAYDPDFRRTRLRSLDSIDDAFQKSKLTRRHPKAKGGLQQSGFAAAECPVDLGSASTVGMKSLNVSGK